MDISRINSASSLSDFFWNKINFEKECEEEEEEMKQIVKNWKPETLTEKELTEAVERFFKFFEVLYKIKLRQKKERKNGKDKN